MRTPLTTKQSAYLDFLRAWIAEHNGVAPSRRDIARGLGTCVANVQAHLERMAKKGYITIHDGARQGITVNP